MLTIVMIIFALVGGASLSVQAAVNGRLGASQGVIRTALLTFVIGSVVSGLLVLFLEPAHEITLLDVPKWQLTGSVLGLIFVLVMVFGVQRIGTGMATVAVILGQLSMSILIDTFGWLGNPVIELSWNRVLAVICLAIALWFIYSAGEKEAQKAAE